MIVAQSTLFDSDADFVNWLNTNVVQDMGYSNYFQGFVTLDDSQGCADTVAMYVEGDVDEGQVGSLAAYFFEGPFAGEYYGCESRSLGKGKLFFLRADFTKCRHDDIGDVMYDIADFFIEGSPIRKTDRSGKGTKGTRAIEGLGNVPIFIGVDG